MQWFRMYAEFASDPKVQMLSETDQRRYVMLLCIRCNDDVTLQDEEVAFQLRVSNDEWLKTKAVFVERGLIETDNSVTAWDKRQYVSDSSAERVRAHREKKKKTVKRDGNVTVTPQNRTDTDTEQIQKESLCVKNARRTYPDGFENFWSVIQSAKSFHRTPLGTKVEAFNEWERHAKHIPPDELLSQWNAYLAQCRRTDTNTKHVCRWIKYRGWELDYGEAMSIEDMARTVRLEKYRRDEDASEQDRNRELGNQNSGKWPAIGYEEA